jgi:hypothetical protein
MRIRDDGRKGIFSRVASHYGLDDPKCAALELSKGKATTDLKHHTGEGIFFAMRLFDRATIRSNGLLLRHTLSGGEWILEDSNDRIRGTTVSFSISRRAIQTLRGVMNDFSTNGNGLLLFDRTEVPVRLASIDSESLMSRSQARRLLRGLEQFRNMCATFYSPIPIPAVATKCRKQRRWGSRSRPIRISSRNLNREPSLSKFL